MALAVEDDTDQGNQWSTTGLLGLLRPHWDQQWHCSQLTMVDNGSSQQGQHGANLRSGHKTVHPNPNPPHVAMLLYIRGQFPSPCSFTRGLHRYPVLQIRLHCRITCKSSKALWQWATFGQHPPQPSIKDAIALMVLANYSLPRNLARLSRLAFALPPPVSLLLAVSSMGGFWALGHPPHKLGGPPPHVLGGGGHLASWEGPRLATWGGCTGGGHCVFIHILRGCGIQCIVRRISCG
jgi:hypothetical protein